MFFRTKRSKKKDESIFPSVAVDGSETAAATWAARSWRRRRRRRRERERHRPGTKIESDPPTPEVAVDAAHSLPLLVAAAAAAAAATTGTDKVYRDDASNFTILSDVASFDGSDEDSSDGSSSSSSSSEDTIEYLKEKWDRMHEQFARRDRLLERISRGKSEAFVRLLRRHEEEVRECDMERLRTRMARQQQREQRQQPSTEQGTERSNENSRANPGDRGTDRKGTSDRWREIVTFELGATLPATLSLIAYCVAHHGIFQATSRLCDELERAWVSYTRSVPVKGGDLTLDAMNVIVFFFGFWLMKLSGYAYFFLSGIDYNCIKFDYHNRLRLGNWDAKILSWVVRHDSVRMMLFTAGYNLCFVVAEYFFGRFVYAAFDDKSAVLAGLPSRQYDFDVCLDDLGPEVEWSSYSFRCQREIEKLEEKYQRLREADVMYTYGVLSGESYETYWSGYHEGLGETEQGVLMTATTEALVYVASFILGIVILTWYGFIFWHQY